VCGSTRPGGGSLTATGPALVSPAILREAHPPTAPSCLLCGATLRPWFAKSGRHFTRCPSCRLVVVPEGVATNEQGQSIYEAEDNVFGADGNDGYYMDHDSNLDNSRLKLCWVRRELAPGSRLLDAGSNFGHFLNVAQDHYEVTGFDLSPAAVAWSKQQFGVRSEEVVEAPARQEIATASGNTGSRDLTGCEGSLRPVVPLLHLVAPSEPSSP
jgi:hypothetical protein